MSNLSQFWLSIKKCFTGHKGKWLTWGMLSMALGSVICTLPQFISDPYQPSHNTSDPQCLGGGHSASDESIMNASDIWYYILLLSGQVFHGLGSAPVYTLGVTFLDESVHPDSSAFYLGIFFGSSVLGPVLGFAGGGLCLKLYGDWLKVDTSKIVQDSSAQDWYGAWWLGFLIAAVFSCFAAAFMSGFPDRLPGAPKHSEKQMTSHSHMSFSTSFADLTHNVKLILTCWPFFWLVVLDCVEALLSTGIIVFFPKIVENFFRQSSSDAGLVTGAAIVPAAVLGNVISGYVIKRFKLHVNGMLSMAFVADMGCMFLGLCFLLYCPVRDITGVTKPYQILDGFSENARYSNLTDTCNVHKLCSPTCFSPVCDTQSDMTYYSPCFAGCSTSVPIKRSIANVGLKLDEPEKEFNDCQCLRRYDAYASQSELSVQSGYCTEPCGLIYPFVILFFLFVFLAFSTSIPIQESELRSVPFNQRSLAFGLRWIFIRILGTIPSPILFGKLVDHSCLKWRYSTSGVPLECLVVNNKQLSDYIVILGSVFKSHVLLCIFLAWKANRSAKPHTRHFAIEKKEMEPNVCDFNVQTDSSTVCDSGPV